MASASHTSRFRPPGHPPAELHGRPGLARGLLPLVTAGLVALPAGALAGPANIPVPVGMNRNTLPAPSTNPARPFVYQGSGNVATNGNAMVVNQLTATLGLNWNSFNVGADASVTFNQPDSLSRVLNRIWSADPSIIMGQISANGQVYLLNQNGILFGKGSQVNVGGLVASALGISETLLEKGLPRQAGDLLSFAWEGDAAGFDKGFVTVEAGAQLVTSAGSPVVLLAPRWVENFGKVTPGSGGEAILAAGGTVLLTAPADPDLRGLLVEVKPYQSRDPQGNRVSLNGTVTNGGTGVIDAPGGVVTLAAMAVNQQGAVSAGKAVNLNGEVMLVAGDTDTRRLTVTQTGNKAEIDWVSGFNVTPDQTVEFVQPDAGSVAYNYVSILDAGRATSVNAETGAGVGRSLVDGTLKANGQLFLINQQGIAFGPGARVTAGSLVASGLNINPDVVENGLLLNDVPSTRSFYLRKAQWQATEASQAMAEFRPATVEVAAGARIETTTENGFALLVGSRVRQEGLIRTPKGQTILAAGADLYLKPPYGQALRGFSPEVNPLFLVQTNGKWQALSRGDDSNAVANTGTVEAPFGNITLVGHEIDQAGTLRTSTSATANGSIRLLARDQLDTEGSPIGESDSKVLDVIRKVDSAGLVIPTQDEGSAPVTASSGSFALGQMGGILRLAAGSTTTVEIDGGDGKQVTADQSFLGSTIEGIAGRIEVAGSTGAAPGAQVSARGGSILFQARNGAGVFARDVVNPIQTTTPTADAINNEVVISPSGGAATLFVGEGARLDVAGAVANKSAADLFVQVELRGDEFAGNPVQRLGVLRGQTAWVDLRDKVGIADLSGWFGKVGQTVEEKLSAGGTLLLASMGSLAVARDAQLDVSGGRVDYAAGEVRESRVVAVSGKDYRLNDAPASASYSGLVTGTRLAEAYTEGRSAGSVQLTAHSLAVDGQLTANTVRGASQRNVGDPVADRYAIPLGGRLVVRDAGQHFALADPESASLDQIVFVPGVTHGADGFTAGSQAGPRLELSSSLVNAGFSRFDIQSDGRIGLPADVSLALAPGGSFKAAGRQVYVAGDITVPGGVIELITRDMSTSAAGALVGSGDARYSTLVVDREASLSTAGVWVNDYLANALSGDPRVLADGGAAPRTGAVVVYEPKAVTGGSIVLTSAHDLDLRAGSSLDVSGGARVTSAGKLESGNAGSIKLTTGGMGKNGAYESHDASNADGNRRDASLFLDGGLSAMALGAGGKLEINTSQVRLGETFTADSRDWSRERRLDSGQVGVALAADFLRLGGFYEFKFVGRDGVTVLDDTHLQPMPIGWSLAQVPDFRYQAAGSAIADFAATLTLDPALRPAPTRLGLASRSLIYGHVSIGDGARLTVSSQGGIDVESAAQLTVLGTLEAPAGTIRLTRPLTASQPGDNTALTYSWHKQSESIYLGSASRLLAGGTTVLDAATRSALAGGATADALRAQNRYKTQVLDGGQVDLNAGLGYLVTRAGSLIDVGGAAGGVTLVSGAGTGLVYGSADIGSAGGRVSLAAREGMFLDGGYRAAGVAGALGGVLSLRFADNEGDRDPWRLEGVFNIPHGNAKGVRQLTLYQSAGEHAALWPGDVAGDPRGGELSINPAFYNGNARLDVALLAAGGFGSWYLGSQDVIRFEGRVAASVANQLRLDAPALFAANDSTRLDLAAGAIQVGNYSQTAVPTSAAVVGGAEAVLRAEDIAVAGTFSWNGFAVSRFASSGEIHFDSRSNIAANRAGDVVSRQGDRPVQGLGRLIQATGLLLAHGKIAQGEGIARVECQGLAIGAFGVFQALSLLLGHAEFDPGIGNGHVGHAGDRLDGEQRLPGPIDLAGADQRAGQIFPRVRVLGFLPKPDATCRGRRGIVPELPFGHGQLSPAGSLHGREQGDALRVVAGFGMVPLLHSPMASLVPDQPMRGAGGRRLVHHGFGLAGTVGGANGRGQIDPGDAVVRFHGQRATEFLFRFAIPGGEHQRRSQILVGQPDIRPVGDPVFRHSLHCGPVGGQACLFRFGMPVCFRRRVGGLGWRRGNPAGQFVDPGRRQNQVDVLSGGHGGGRQADQTAFAVEQAATAGARRLGGGREEARFALNHADAGNQPGADRQPQAQGIAHREDALADLRRLAGAWWCRRCLKSLDREHADVAWQVGFGPDGWP